MIKARQPLSAKLIESQIVSIADDQLNVNINNREKRFISRLKLDIGCKINQNDFNR